jgi:hypothetical protein
MPQKHKLRIGNDKFGNDKQQQGKDDTDTATSTITTQTQNSEALYINHTNGTEITSENFIKIYNGQETNISTASTSSTNSTDSTPKVHSRTFLFHPPKEANIKRHCKVHLSSLRTTLYRYAAIY